MNAQATARKALRGNGLRCTRSRVAILSLLLRATKPMSHQDVMACLGGVDKVTVYRTLEAFVQIGIVHRAYAHDRRWLYETADRCGERCCHPHFTCSGCGETTCLVDVHIPLAEGLGKGFIPERQRVHIEGLCPECAGK